MLKTGLINRAEVTGDEGCYAQIYVRQAHT